MGDRLDEWAQRRDDGLEDYLHFERCIRSVGSEVGGEMRRERKVSVGQQGHR